MNDNAAYEAEQSMRQDEVERVYSKRRDLEDAHNDSDDNQESLIMELSELKQSIDHLNWSIEQDEKLLRKSQDRMKKVEELLSAPNF